MTIESLTSTPTPTSAERVGDPSYCLFALAAGSWLQVGTLATTYFSTLALAPTANADQAVAA